MYDSNTVVAVIIGAAALASVLLYVAWRRRNTPAERERRRRLQVNTNGRITDGTVIDFLPFDGEEGSGPRLIQYIYKIGGVEYSAAQDVSALLPLIGDDPSRFIGTVNVKYHNRNPFNSIVICEDWSGLRTQSIEHRVS